MPRPAPPPSGSSSNGPPRSGPTSTADTEREAVLRICAALDGLPLAIELAAARLRSLSATEIADRLGAFTDERPDQLFRLLSRGSRTAGPRQRTLRGVVDWSWDLLTAPERVLMRRASVFAGGWTLDAAEAVCTTAGDGEEIDPDDVLDLVDSLVDKSLVVVHRSGDGRVRYRMLETIRAYAAERLEQAGETGCARRAHIRCFLDLATTAEPRLRRAGQLDWLRRLTADHDNLGAALHRAVGDGDTGSGLRMIAALTTYWMLRGVRHESVAPARRLLEAVGPRPPDGLAEEYALCVVAAAPAAGAEELAPHLAAAARVVEAGPGRYPVVFLLWAPIAGVPDHDTYARYRAALAGRPSDPWFEGLDHLGNGYQHWVVRGGDPEAEAAFSASLRCFRELGDRWGTILALTHLAGFLTARGDAARAVELVDEALALAEELGAVENRTELLCQRGQAGLRAGDHRAARADFHQAVELARRSGAREYRAVAHLGLAECARLLGEPAEARRLCELALSECLPAWFSGEWTREEVLLALGRISAADGEPERARAHYRDALVIRHTRNRPFTGAVAEAAAELVRRSHGPQPAAELLGTARALRGTDVSLDPDAAATRSACRDALGDAGYEAAYARGAALDPDRALDALRTALS